MIVKNRPNKKARIELEVKVILLIKAD